MWNGIVSSSAVKDAIKPVESACRPVCSWFRERTIDLDEAARIAEEWMPAIDPLAEQPNPKFGHPAAAVADQRPQIIAQGATMAPETELWQPPLSE